MLLIAVFSCSHQSLRKPNDRKVAQWLPFGFTGSRNNCLISLNKYLDEKTGYSKRKKLEKKLELGGRSVRFSRSVGLLKKLQKLRKNTINKNRRRHKRIVPMIGVDHSFNLSFLLKRELGGVFIPEEIMSKELLDSYQKRLIDNLEKIKEYPERKEAAFNNYDSLQLKLAEVKLKLNDFKNGKVEYDENRMIEMSYFVFVKSSSGEYGLEKVATKYADETHLKIIYDNIKDEIKRFERDVVYMSFNQAVSIKELENLQRVYRYYTTKYPPLQIENTPDWLANLLTRFKEVLDQDGEIVAEYKPFYRSWGLLKNKMLKSELMSMVIHNAKVVKDITTLNLDLLKKEHELDGLIKDKKKNKKLTGKEMKAQEVELKKEINELKKHLEAQKKFFDELPEEEKRFLLGDSSRFLDAEAIERMFKHNRVFSLLYRVNPKRLSGLLTTLGIRSTGLGGVGVLAAKIYAVMTYAGHDSISKERCIKEEVLKDDKAFSQCVDNYLKEKYTVDNFESYQMELSALNNGIIKEMKPEFHSMHNDFLEFNVMRSNKTRKGQQMKSATSEFIKSLSNCDEEHKRSIRTIVDDELFRRAIFDIDVRFKGMTITKDKVEKYKVGGYLLKCHQDIARKGIYLNLLKKYFDGTNEDRERLSGQIDEIDEPALSLAVADLEEFISSREILLNINQTDKDDLAVLEAAAEVNKELKKEFEKDSN